MYNNFIINADLKILKFIRKINPWLSRISIGIIFFWFGLLKVISTSPANPLVQELQMKTLPFLEPSSFIAFFGYLEMVIGVMFLIPKLTRIAIFILVLHMGTTFMPLIFLPKFTWQQFMTPTLEGQYIIKNLVMIALAISIGSRLEPLRQKIIKNNQ